MGVLCYLALGTNLGDRRANLQAARAGLGRQLKLLAESSVYETEPWGYAEQPAFLNQVLQVETELLPLELLAFLKQLETELGRQPSFRYGPRQIDLDILFYGDMVLELPQLSLPHPRLAERAFVLAPLVELAPSWRHPQLGLSMTELLARLDASGVKLWREVKEV